MRGIKRPFRNVVMPVMILAPLTWLMIGCVYIPWFEQKTDSKAVDFRPLLGPADSDKPVRVGHVSRSQVYGRLGQPLAVSDDGRVVVYGIDTFYGYWVSPLCFAADTGIAKSTVVRLQFDDRDVLTRYDVESASSLARMYDDGEAIQKLNNRGIRTPDRYSGVRPAPLPSTTEP